MNRTGIRWDPAPTEYRSDSGQKDAAALAGDLSQRSPDRSPDSLEERHPGETMESQLGRIQASVENAAVGRLVEERRRVAHLLECDIDLEASRHPAAQMMSSRQVRFTETGEAELEVVAEHRVILDLEGGRPR